MKPCEEFELEIEMRLHGALSPAQSAALDAHLASCAECRAFESLSRETEKKMATQAMTDAGAVDWQATKERARRILRRDDWNVLKVLAVFVVAQVLLFLVRLSTRPQRIVLLSVISASVITFCIAAVALRIIRRHRELRAYERNGGDLLDLMRRRLSWDYRYARAASWLFLLAAGLPVVFVGRFHHVGAFHHDPKVLWGRIVANALCCLAFLAYFQLVRVPALKRELAALKS